MTLTGVALKTERTRAHYGDKILLGNTPAALIKAGKKEDVLTPEEMIGHLYGREVDHIDIFFKDGNRKEIIE